MLHACRLWQKRSLYGACGIVNPGQALSKRWSMLRLRKAIVLGGYWNRIFLPLCIFLYCVTTVLSSHSLLPSSLGWGCASCNQSRCPPVSCNESLQYVDGCGCCVLCGKLEGERCGGDGDTGGRCNGSRLRCAYRLGSIFGESRMGVCENGEYGTLVFARVVLQSTCDIIIAWAICHCLSCDIYQCNPCLLYQRT